ncbi:MAG: class I SAM-dependent methyltransferase [Kiritimatiellaeota bacterium]|nr:class I SAM-dependent methyltransferase [Kiritimatiellota bacterium]
MKVRESGMPDEEMWASFFDPPAILSALQLTATCRDIVEFGCGYGTFTIPAARIVSGMVHALDVEPEMVAASRAKARAAGLTNVNTRRRDFADRGTGLPDNSVDYAMLFNILHAARPVALLREAYRVLIPGGKVGIIHWNCDADTPRGPPMDIRPSPELCCAWGEEAGFDVVGAGTIDLPPYHYGIVLRRPIPVPENRP